MRRNGGNDCSMPRLATSQSDLEIVEFVFLLSTLRRWTSLCIVVISGRNTKNQVELLPLMTLGGPVTRENPPKKYAPVS